MDGNTGIDIMNGGTCNDFYVVDAAGDRVFETIGQGFDTIVARASYALAGGVEVELLRTVTPAATTRINLVGNGFANTIEGNAGINTLNGVAGNDIVNGSGGNDRLIGGLGIDIINGPEYWLRSARRRRLGQRHPDRRPWPVHIMIGGSGADDFDFNSVAESASAQPAPSSATSGTPVR